MFSLNLASNRLYRRYYHYSLAGFGILSLGYLLREQFAGADAPVALLMGFFPNLFGSFPTPFLLFLLLVNRYPSYALRVSGSCRSKLLIGPYKSLHIISNELKVVRWRTEARKNVERYALTSASA